MFTLDSLDKLTPPQFDERLWQGLLEFVPSSFSEFEIRRIHTTYANFQAVADFIREKPEGWKYQVQAIAKDLLDEGNPLEKKGSRRRSTSFKILDSPPWITESKINRDARLSEPRLEQMCMVAYEAASGGVDYLFKLCEALLLERGEPNPAQSLETYCDSFVILKGDRDAVLVSLIRNLLNPSCNGYDWTITFAKYRNKAELKTRK